MALTKDFHSLFSSFTVAHELAHDSQQLGAPRGLIWFEARADFLAYAVTSKPEIAFPKGRDYLGFKENGELFKTSIPPKRSMRAPTIRVRADLIANRDAYHENSELISSFLFRLADQFGLEKSLQFLRWMDSQKEQPSLDLDLTPVPPGFERDKSIRSGPEIKQAWIHVVDNFFGWVDGWTSSQDIEKEIRDWINAERVRINRT
jgi:hypothetical protein